MSGGDVLPASLIPVAQALLSGLLVGGVYGLLSIGFSLAFGVMRIVNFAHGDLVMYGMYVGVVAVSAFGIDPIYAVPASFVLMALLGTRSTGLSIAGSSVRPRFSNSLLRLASASSCR